MKRFPNVSDITPDAFERQVRAWLESVSCNLESFSATHRERLAGADGEYEIDVVASFRALAGASFVVLIECKKHKTSIKREVVQALRDKLISVGGQKAIVVSTAGFQSGAQVYAQAHGIALVQIVNGAIAYVQASASSSMAIIPDCAEDYAGLFYSPSEGCIMQPFTEKRNYGFADFITGQ